MDLDTLYNGCLSVGGVLDFNLSLILPSIVCCLKDEFEGCASGGGDSDAEDPLGEDGGSCPPPASAPAGCC